MAIEKSKEANQFNELVLVPKKMLEDIHKDQQRIIELIGKIPENNLPEGTVANKYITEAKAKEILGKGTTWFWQMRKEGKLKFRKVGSKIYYSLLEIEKLFEVSNEEYSNE